jgi:hypothetical protein
MLMALAVGEPSLGRVTGEGELDATPLILAVTVLVLIRVVFGIRVRWYAALVVVLAAPLLVGLANEFSYPLTLALVLVVGAIVSVARRGMDPPADPS